MNPEIANLSITGRQAAASQDWATVHACATGILQRAPREPEGLFLLGLVEKAAQRPNEAIKAFERVLRIDAGRYDAAVELASQHSMARRNGAAAELLQRFEADLANSPRYLHQAATVYTEIGMPARAWPLYQKASELQPGLQLFEANLAACAVYVGEIERAKTLYRSLLEKNPNHQRNHYQLARLARATDRTHIEQMQAVLESSSLSPDRNIFIYYALGKEHEDLGDWEKAFEYYKRGGDAVCSVANYDINDDLRLIDTLIEVCDAEWLAQERRDHQSDKTPLFVVGLPRTGTTLTERILASHSRVQSVGETEFLQMVIRRESGIETVEKMNPDIVRAFARRDIGLLRDGYLDTVAYRLGDEPVFIDKLPFNSLFLGFIAKAWPDTPIVLLRRNPMDSCFSIYKQVFTWAYKYSYSLEHLAAYYVGYERLCKHWKTLLGDRLIEVEYEQLVSDQENQTRRLLERVGLDFEDACLAFEKNVAPSTTASSVQVRQKVHTGSVGKWRRFEKQLEPLRRYLADAGIDVD